MAFARNSDDLRTGPVRMKSTQGPQRIFFHHPIVDLSRSRTIDIVKMLRRQVRERRAYLHQKALSQKSNVAHLRRLKAHIDKDKDLPKELQDPKLRKDLRYDEAQLMADEEDNIDDEYYNMGMREPRILITTSRDPSSRLLQFSKVPPVKLMERLMSGNETCDSEFNED